jgi:predicted GIY-YIG superfamily endonuclease
MLSITWKKCGDDQHYCSLENLNLDTVGKIGGVYIIWHEGKPGRVVRLGQTGDIADRLGKHRNDKAITAYRQDGTLRVTWATVPAQQRDAVERYLADKWPPLVGDAFPDVEPLAVNSPFAA